MVGGRVLGGRYRLEEPIASGGMGAVHAATDERLHRRVAIKLLKDDLAQDERFVTRFEREARAAAALSHPNVAGVYDYGEDAGTRYIVMELAAGRDLSRLLREEGPLAPGRARAIAAQICAALAHAHAAGLVHRDVKPANVVVGDDDRVKVTDFGIARAAGESTLTVTGSVLGSAHYMSPEQASGGAVTPAADVYAAGIVLYEMLTNALPFTGDSPLSVALRHVNDEVPPPSSVNPAVPPTLDEIVARATAKDPALRWPEAAAMAAALAGGGRTEVLPAGGAETTQVVGPQGASATTTVWPIPGARYDPRRLGTRVLVAAAVLALLAVVTWVWLLGERGDDARRRAAAQDRRTAAPSEPTATKSAEPTSEGFDLPSFVGEPFKEAEKALEERGLTVLSSEQASEEEKDEVVGSDPPPGTVVEPGDTVTLIISTGKPEEDSEEGEEGPGNSEEAPGHDKDKDEDKEKDKDEE